tara:strand:+ start:68 stop:766 length:699 start_codon:yes stop_codon:yes gene_type:complete
MATFQAQVEGLTNIAITDGSLGTPTTTELSTFLRDGVLDVTNNWLKYHPQDAERFQKKTTSDSQGVEIGRSQIVTVLREANADGSSDGSTAWRYCRNLPASLQSRVVDSDSIHYASIFNPVYILENGVVNVYPVPSSNNGIKIYHVNINPVNGSGATLVHSHDDILYFPVDKIYLVVIYAAIKTLEAKMSWFTIDEEDIELVQGITQNIAVLKEKYNLAFMPKPESQQQQGG